MIRLLVTDIDGVLTDGKLYISRTDEERKTICFKDLDAVNILKKENILFAMITGEDNDFVENIKQRFKPDYLVKGCKDKVTALNRIITTEQIDSQEICYIGDGKYDIEVLKQVGFGTCPSDAIQEVKNVANKVLSATGGAGCLAETVTYIQKMNRTQDVQLQSISVTSNRHEVHEIMIQHRNLLDLLLNDAKLMQSVEQSIATIREALESGNQILLCGNGGSAADAQHLATEFVSRFYMERKALNAEALTVNSSSLTAIGNDYNYSRVFSRQVEAKGKSGDVLIGISTSGGSSNVLEAFRVAQEIGMKNIAFVGSDSSKVENSTDIIVSVPSSDTPRIQEMHIMIGHIICECVEKEINYG